MKKLVGLVFLGVWAMCIWLYLTRPDFSEIKLQDGDLVFQTSTSNQSLAILTATASLYTHMGIVRAGHNGFVVLEAAGTVRETPLKDWARRGVMQRIAVYRHPNMPKETAETILVTAGSYKGKPYDPFFSFKNDAIYCSELPYLAYKQAGMAIGKVQRLSELHFDNMLVRQLIKKRWKRHEECLTRHFGLKECYDYLLSQELITPDSIAKDASLVKVYSNYPF